MVKINKENIKHKNKNNIKILKIIKININIQNIQ